NVVFILADDLGYGDFGAFNGGLSHTPALDALMRESVCLTQHYAASPVCNPSRASLMTGLHTGHAPVRANRVFKAKNTRFTEGGQFPLPAATITVAQLLQQRGYATACMGKWGMGQFDTSGSPLKKGFDHFFGYNCQGHAHSYFPEYLYTNDARIELPENAHGAQKTYAQNLIINDVLGWVRKQKDHPFFLFFPVTLPHGKYEIDDLGAYKDEPWTDTEKQYAAMVARLDSDVGRLLSLLKELDLDEHTLVLFAGDNGSAFDPNSPLGRRFNQSMGGKLRNFKRSLYEGGLRQAALARWPGTIPAGRVSDEPWAFWDFLPTAVELSGAKLPANFKPDGLSLVSCLKGGPAPKRDYFYWELHERKPIQAVRFGDWKAVRNNPAAPPELYDLATDAGETNNLAPRHPDLVAKAVRLMREAHVDDPNWPMKRTNQ
ncbi:MAG: arylsulfatase, partial [Kiritimatiellaeota bacterium]|nr:arylsulfatase [Kiritimatiellota bacterium]